jgi:glutathione peroxidase
LTDQNYRELVMLDEGMRAAGQPFEVLAFPCNQFKNQEPGPNAQVAEFARGRYGAKFSLFAKTEVNGASQSPVFAELKAALAERDEPGATESGARDIEWNFVKILVNREGVAVKRYGMKVPPSLIKADIEQLLAQQ